LKKQNAYCVVTTIQAPTECMEILSEKWPGEEGSVLIVGDSKGPFEYDLPKSRLVTIQEQRELDFELASILPEKHYARKNLGYLMAMEAGAEVIFETDDDNAPNEHWRLRDAVSESSLVDVKDWYNVYGDFSKEQIWPRGYPLDDLLNCPHKASKTEPTRAFTPLQQGLADRSPDVDAVWRLILDKPIDFDRNPSVRLAKGTWCPFNSQSTWWWRDAYPLMYLPSLCPFRMTDIWRGFVAQRCLWELGYELVFHASEVYQERNVHDFMVDFQDEIPGYLRNKEIRNALDGLKLKPGKGVASENLRACYVKLVEMELIPEHELKLVDAWIADLAKIGI